MGPLADSRSGKGQAIVAAGGGVPQVCGAGAARTTDDLCYRERYFEACASAHVERLTVLAHLENRAVFTR